MNLKQIKPPFSDVSKKKGEFLKKLAKYIIEASNISHSSIMVIKIDEKSIVRELSLVMLEKINIDEFIPLIHQIPDFFPDLYRLGLSIYCLKSLPKSFNNLSQLIYLQIGGDQFEKIDEGLFTNMPDLKILAIKGKFTTIPDSIGKLKNLEGIGISNSPNLQFLPESFTNLENLSKITIRDVSLISLPFSMGKLQNLKDLLLGRIPIEFIPESIGECTNLSEITIRSCNNLQTLPDSLGNLPNFKILYVASCKELKRIPDTLANAPKLEKVQFWACPKLSASIKVQSKLQKIKNVVVDRCGSGWII